MAACLISLPVTRIFPDRMENICQFRADDIQVVFAVISPSDFASVFGFFLTITPAPGDCIFPMTYLKLTDLQEHGDRAAPALMRALPPASDKFIHTEDTLQDLITPRAVPDNAIQLTAGGVAYVDTQDCDSTVPRPARKGGSAKQSSAMRIRLRVVRFWRR